MTEGFLQNWNENEVSHQLPGGRLGPAAWTASVKCLVQSRMLLLNLSAASPFQAHGSIVLYDTVVLWWVGWQILADKL